MDLCIPNRSSFHVAVRGLAIAAAVKTNSVMPLPQQRKHSR